MNGLRPPPLSALLARALAEHDRGRGVFGLPRRSYWQGHAGLDLSVDLLGERAATPLGPAAGPHTQLAGNLVVAWLAGARALELKTIQANDRLAIPRPCIDAPDLGYNVEWSQELTLAESAVEYATAWMLVHALAARGLLDDAAGPRDVHFEASVGYDLGGIASDGVARFLDTMADASSLIAHLRASVPADLRAALDTPVPPRIARTVTLSTFHGCPPDEIERIVEHLFARHAMNVVVKFNPTLLGFDEVSSLVRDRLGYTDVTLDRAAFDEDLHWDDALSLFARLEAAAARADCRLGAKFTNTLVVRNQRGVLAGNEVYLSGAPLHPIAITLAERFTRATGGRFPISFSGGVNAENFADTVACGLAPVTTCTDLLRPTGYRRLPRYLKALTSAMSSSGARSIDAFVRARGPDASANLAAYAARVADEPAYRALARTPPPARTGPLPVFDCASCNNCALVCPNGAFFSVATPPALAASPLALKEERQWVVFADLCNDCGNCATFCPQEGAPQRLKPRFYVSRDAYLADAPADGVLVEASAEGGAARLNGWIGRMTPVALGGGARPADPIAAWRALRADVMADVNPVSAAVGAARP